MWKQKKSKQKSSVYLKPKRELLYLNLRSRAKKRTIGLLKNGGTTKLHPIKLNKMKAIFTNTCAIDSLIQILAVAYCDSIVFSNFVDNNIEYHTLWALIANLLRDGVTVQTYKKRGMILSEICDGQPVPGDLMLFSAEQSIDTLISRLFTEMPSAVLKVNCQTCNKNTLREIIIFTSCVEVSSLHEVNEEFVREQFKNSVKEFIESAKCCNDSNNAGMRKRRRCCSVEKAIQLSQFLMFSFNNLHPNATDIGIDVKIKLKDIPKQIEITEETFYLQGVVTTPLGQSSADYNSLGHYTCHCYREPLQIWQLYDDLKEHVVNVNENTTVSTQLYVYAK